MFMPLFLVANSQMLAIMVFFKQLFRHRGSANKIWFAKGFRNIFRGSKGFRIEKKVEKHWPSEINTLHFKQKKFIATNWTFLFESLISFCFVYINFFSTLMTASNNSIITSSVSTPGVSTNVSNSVKVIIKLS